MNKDLLARAETEMQAGARIVFWGEAVDAEGLAAFRRAMAPPPPAEPPAPSRQASREAP